MLQSWRWYGPSDPIGLEYIRQAGAAGIVSALPGLPTKVDRHAVDALRDRIAAAGMTWSAYESIPVASEIKLRSGNFREKIDEWKDSLVTIARAGVRVINYNFMPVVDWTRTDLHYRLPSTGFALRFDMTDFAVYDLLVLARRDAAADYTADQIAAAQARFAVLDEETISQLERTVIAGLPGGSGSYSRKAIATEIARFDGMTVADLRNNLLDFVREIAPIAEELNVRLCIHADDPPIPLFGLPRVVSTVGDLRALFDAVPSLTNGLTLCTGSLASSPGNDVLGIVREFADRIHFAHLRNVRCDRDNSFLEVEHLEGDVDMAAVVFALLDEERRRAGEGRADCQLPMRPDHGHLLGDDIAKIAGGEKVNAGYSYVGRLKGLAELRGVIKAHELVNTKCR